MLFKERNLECADASRHAQSGPAGYLWVSAGGIQLGLWGFPPRVHSNGRRRPIGTQVGYGPSRQNHGGKKAGREMAIEKVRGMVRGIHGS